VNEEETAMPTTSSAAGYAPRWQALEFSLVVVMLGILTVLVLFVLCVPIDGDVDGAMQGKELLEHRKTVLEYRKYVLSVLITAFGAWVGAGAAYFFGRENLREAANSMLRMRGGTPQELLRQLRVQDVPPKALDLVVHETTPVRDVFSRFRADAKLWFVTVVKEDRTLSTVVHREGVSRYVLDDPAQSKNVIDSHTLSQLIAFLNAGEALKKSYLDIYVKVKRDTTLAEAHELMQKKEVFIAIVADADNIPVGYIDTGDVRKMLLGTGLA
jgi:hypothetical protein